ncbi:kelch-like protein 24 [Gigantopelta aegis]|uniref:kelch-like protein 24 n=1 Tax=Gigantopelta aegis TaxID=1735272 RepID=UPI001B88CAE0|nr:kelch-like protein 24 [Gigantopelta aegis]XP_041363938.1 kelch-like protein 24 [Gigantopelta aegis]XP_041363939.1 kelch-like protein 24 [Gigantopelta aegis]
MSQNNDGRSILMEHLRTGLRRFYDDRRYTDTEIIVDNTSFFCHRVIMAAVSPYFDAMYSSGMKESQDGIVMLQEVDRETFKAVIDFIYFDKKILTTENVQVLLHASVMLQIRSLQLHCEEFLLGNVDAENCLAMWKLAHVYNCEYLITRLHPFVASHFPKIWLTDDFLQLEKQEVLELIDSNDLKTPNEEMVCDAVFKWITKDFQNRSQFVDELFEHLRLPLVRAEYLVEVLEQHPFVRESERCRKVLEEAKRYHLLPARRSEFISPRLTYRNYGAYEEVICCIGGSGNISRTSREVICYSCQQQTWFTLSAMIYDPGIEFASCAYGNAIFVSGGSGKLKGLMYFQSVQNKWFACETLLMGRRRHSMVAVEDSLYVLGGYNDTLTEDDKTLASIEEFNITMGQWQLAGYLTMPIRSASASVIKGNVFVFGGITMNDAEVQSVQCFNIRNRTTTVVCNLPFSSGLTSSVVLNREVYIIVPDGKILSYNQESEVAYKSTVPNFHRCGYGIVQHEGKVFILGGIGSSKTYNEILTFDPANSSVEEYGRTRLPHELFGFGCVKTVISKSFLVN